MLQNWLDCDWFAWRTGLDKKKTRLWQNEEKYNQKKKEESELSKLNDMR